MFVRRVMLSSVFRSAKLNYFPLRITVRQNNYHASEPTIRGCLNKLRRVFEASGITEAEESAMYIVASALSKKTLHGVHLGLPVNKHALQIIESMCSKRLEGCPVQYVINEWDFHSVNLIMRPPVFIPRPETEELVELALSDPVVQGANHFLEVGCGSGAISIALLKQLSLTSCTAIECNEQACQLTNENALKNAVAHRLNILNTKWTPELVERSSAEWKKFDFFISNPPYIPTKDMDSLQREVIRYEDHLALDGGIEGMDTIYDILCCVHTILKPGSSVWLEVASCQPPKVQQIVQNKPEFLLEYVETYTDFNSRPRFCHLRTV